MSLKKTGSTIASRGLFGVDWACIWPAAIDAKGINTFAFCPGIFDAEITRIFIAEIVALLPPSPVFFYNIQFCFKLFRHFCIQKCALSSYGANRNRML